MKFFLGLILLFNCSLLAQERDVVVRVQVKAAIDSLVRDEDTDNDLKITIEDPHISGTERGDKRFRIPAVDRRLYEVAGTYYIANLLQELKLAEESGKDTVELSGERIHEQPVDRISRSIREVYWQELTRRTDEKGLQAMLKDEKTATSDGLRYVYVAPSDKLATTYFGNLARLHREWKLKVVILPEKVSASYVRGLDGRHGILPLSLVKAADGTVSGEPFVVPGGRFNEMYGWDSYFIVLGLLEDGKIELAKAMVNNHV